VTSDNGQIIAERQPMGQCLTLRIRHTRISAGSTVYDRPRQHSEKSVSRSAKRDH
jgi:hypothetical protein